MRWKFDATTRVVIRGNRAVRLSPAEARVFVALRDRSGVYVHPVYLCRLRDKLELIGVPRDRVRAR